MSNLQSEKLDKATPKRSDISPREARPYRPGRMNATSLPLPEIQANTELEKRLKAATAHLIGLSESPVNKPLDKLSPPVQEELKLMEAEDLDNPANRIIFSEKLLSNGKNKSIITEMAKDLGIEGEDYREFQSLVEMVRNAKVKKKDVLQAMKEEFESADLSQDSRDALGELMQEFDENVSEGKVNWNKIKQKALSWGKIAGGVGLLAIFIVMKKLMSEGKQNKGGMHGMHGLHGIGHD